MTVSTHKDLAGLNIHTPVTWEVADATARLAIVATSIDIHKIAWQLDTNESWFLVSVGPNVWKQFAGPVGPTGATGPAGTTDHLLLTHIGINSHDAIDTHIANSFAQAVVAAIIFG